MTTDERTAINYFDKNMRQWLQGEIQYAICSYEVEWNKLKENPNDEIALWFKKQAEDFFLNSPFMLAGGVDGRKILDRVREQQIMKMVEERKRKMKQQKPAASVKESEDSK